MEINGSSMSAGLAGMQSAQRLLDKTAQKISETGIPTPEQDAVQKQAAQAAQPAQQVAPVAEPKDWNAQSETDLAKEMTNLMVADKSQAANAETVKTSDQMLKELLYMNQ